MALALFDLDHTLLDADSDQLWGDFLYARCMVDGRYQQQKDRFYADYLRGELNIDAFAQAMLAPLIGYTQERLQPLLSQFAKEKLHAKLRAAGLRCWHKHREQGDRCVIVTATNSVLAAASAQMLDADELIATDAQWCDGHLSGHIVGIPAYREGKLQRVQQWCEQQSLPLRDAHFYSDSHNDLPLLSAVGFPVAVSPDERLRAEALSRGWPVELWS